MSTSPLCNEEYATLARFRRELRVFTQFSEHAALNAGLTAQQYQALLAIRASPAIGMRIGELAREILIRPNSATELVDRLQELGLVTRRTSDEDRREVRVVLTPSSNQVLESLAAMHRIELQRIGPLLKELLARL